MKAIQIALIWCSVSNLEPNELLTFLEICRQIDDETIAEVDYSLLENLSQHARSCVALLAVAIIVYENA